jgi:phage gp36-like protein
MQIFLVPMAINRVIVYLLLDDLGKLGHVWREIDEARANEQAIVDDILNGRYERPLRVVAFETEEGWSCDVTKEIAAKLLDASTQGRSLGAKAWEFIERVTAGASVN